ncbi:translation release factor eRF1 family protein [Nadsonia fulvescens var. elongata DSM 6958]|uniref:Protein DOM34 homolog n=1 Tax=Nadsonia fulvescens var. elongata DSM 6958 TaxID=857566 RepID=A0A1E3PNY4_9ASCO|nr:translation release factor eRF1 family protein [Nadsonia fulvescens var. elongata DSM 6958]
MKLGHKNIDKSRCGSVTISLENDDDKWYFYNLVQVGDELKTKSMRKVAKMGKDGLPIKGATSRKLLLLKIKIEKIEYSNTLVDLRFSGRVSEAVDEVPNGTYHSFEIEMNKPVTLFKDEWDSHDVDLIEKACDPNNQSEVGAVVLEEGFANICLVTEVSTLLRQRVDVSLPRKKRGDNSGYEKAVTKFYSTVWETMKRNLQFDKLKVILIASPGFTAKGLWNFIFDLAIRENDLETLKLKPKFVIAHSSTGHVHALNEILKDTNIQKQLADTRYAKDTAVLDEFFKLLNLDDGRAWYGLKHMTEAVEKGAVDKLLLSSNLFRNSVPALRKQYIKLTEDVEASNGTVYILSSAHESGQQLDGITGIAGILRFPMEMMDSEDEEDSEDESEDDD